MGYCISVNEKTVKFHKSNAQDIVMAIRGYANKNKNIRWVDNDILLDDESTIDDIFEEIRYPLYKNGDWYEIDYFSGEKLGDELYIFNSIAKFVEPSYIEYIGEDGDIFRFVFDGNTCKEVYPDISWGDDNLLQRCSNMIGYLAECVDVQVDGLDELIMDINIALGIQ